MNSSRHVILVDFPMSPLPEALSVFFFLSRSLFLHKFYFVGEPILGCSGPWVQFVVFSKPVGEKEIGGARGPACIPMKRIESDRVKGVG